MELNFDKEMDALLRQTARQENVAATAADVHLDVDEMAAFSANALPVKARARAMEHLVDCGNCRTILSNLVFFENQDEEKFSTVAATIGTAPAVKEASLLERITGFFTFPTLAYGMAGLVAVFAVGIGVMVYRSSSSGPEVALLNKQESPVAANAMPKQYEDSDQISTPMDSNMSANSPGIASAANSAMGGAIAVYPPTPAGNAVSTSTLSPADGPTKSIDKIQEYRIQQAPVGGAVYELSPATPAPATVRRDEEAPKLAKPEQQHTLNDQVTRGQDSNLRNIQNNNVQILTPDGSDKDRSRKSVSGEAGATLPREAARGEKDRDEKENKNTVDTVTSAPASKTETKKAAGKRQPKKKDAAKAAAAEATPTPSPEKKKPDEEEHPPCK